VADVRLMLADVSAGLTRPKVLESPKIFQVTRIHGREVVVKLLVVALRWFVDSVKVPDKLDAAEIIDLADELASIYTHDSIMDIVLALKEGRMSGTKFYQSLDTTKVYALITAYFDRKAEWLQHINLDQKVATHSDQAVAWNSAAPAVVSSMALRIPEAHPAAESLRRKLTITKGKLAHGLISEEEAEEQRDQVKKVLGNGRRLPGPDYKKWE
jgi:hypothetical protein